MVGYALHISQFGRPRAGIGGVVEAWVKCVC